MKAALLSGLVVLLAGCTAALPPSIEQHFHGVTAGQGARLPVTTSTFDYQFDETVPAPSRPASVNLGTGNLDDCSCELHPYRPVAHEIP